MLVAGLLGTVVMDLEDRGLSRRARDGYHLRVCWLGVKCTQ